jgi:hypothetical protein
VATHHPRSNFKALAAERPKLACPGRSAPRTATSHTRRGVLVMKGSAVRIRSSAWQSARSSRRFCSVALGHAGPAGSSQRHRTCRSQPCVRSPIRPWPRRPTATSPTRQPPIPWRALMSARSWSISTFVTVSASCEVMTYSRSEQLSHEGPAEASSASIEKRIAARIGTQREDFTFGVPGVDAPWRSAIADRGGGNGRVRLDDA